MQETRGHHTDLHRLHLIDADDKEDKHEDHGNAELEPELGAVPLAQLAVGEREVSLTRELATC